MRLISRIHIEGFRSVRKATVSDVSDFTVFAGLNYSGKSNVLRALNAYFNGETESNRFIDVDEDFFRLDLRKRKKRKKIIVSLAFDLPYRFAFRKGLQQVEQFLGGRSFEIRKEWMRDQFFPVYYPMQAFGRNQNLFKTAPGEVVSDESQPEMDLYR